MNAASQITSRPQNLTPIDPHDTSSVNAAVERETMGHLATRAWDKVADFFYGTDREEAKQCLFDLYDPKCTDKQKIEHFYTLQSLTGKGYQDRFQVWVADGVEHFSLVLDGNESGQGVLISRESVCVNMEKLTAELRSEDQGDTGEKQLVNALSRSEYIVGSQFVEKYPDDDHDVRTHKQRAAFEQGLNALNCTAEEKKTIRRLATQGTFGCIQSNSQPSPSSNTDHWIAPQCPSNTGQSLQFHVDRSDGVIRLRALNVKDIAHLTNTVEHAQKLDAIRYNAHLCKSEETMIDLAIDAEGQASIVRLNYYVNRGSDRQ